MLSAHLEFDTVAKIYFFKCKEQQNWRKNRNNTLKEQQNQAVDFQSLDVYQEQTQARANLQYIIYLQLAY